MKATRGHKFWFWFLRTIFKPYTKLRLNYKREKYGKKYADKPYLFLCNHTHKIDPFLMSLSFKMPIHFVASDHIFNRPIVSSIIRHTVAPIPKTKSMADTRTIREIFSLTKQNRSVAIFPEGNINYFGTTCSIPFSIAKLVKHLKIPVIFYNISGGHLTQPRWARWNRYGEMSGKIARVWQPEEFAKLSHEEIFETIKKELYVNAYEIQKEQQQKYRGFKRAEFAERGLFTCPRCESITSMKSKGNYLFCKECGYKVYFDNMGNILPVDVENGHKFNIIPEWNDWQLKRLEQFNIFKFPQEKLIYEEGKIRLSRAYVGKRIKKLGKKGKAYLYGDRIEYVSKKVVKKIYFDKISEFTPQGKKKFIFYMENGKIFEFKGTIKFSPYRMLVHIQQAMRGNESRVDAPEKLGL